MHADADRPFRVLDAGCGRQLKYVEYGPDAHIVGLDVSSEALEANETVHEKVLGDLRTYPLQPASFDEIHCQDVLEHLPDPERAIANMAQALRPGGRIIVGVPNVVSRKGLLTKFTSHRLHVWAYRHVLRMADAGAPGRGPFPTYLRWCLRPTGWRKLAAANGLDVEAVRVYESDGLRAFWERHRVAWALWRAAPFGDARRTECEVILRRPTERGEAHAVSGQIETADD